ncbi:MAG: c-type cytochrome [Gammaproteobacteria bacterium]|nr:c-type cytochrome [Gammaproteobacteria bacterium]
MFRHVIAESTRASRRAFGVAAALLYVVQASSVLAQEASTHQRIGQGDSRIDYESVGYRTDSKSLASLEGEASNLITLLESPPLGLPETVGVQHLTPAIVSLGRRLFFDRRLSFNGTLSCAMCHIPEQGFSQYELSTPVGIEGRFVKRNAPALYNVVYRRTLFHDGREDSLVRQIWGPLLARNEMGNPSMGSVLNRLKKTGEYTVDFAQAFDAGINVLTLGQAIAGYQQVLLSADSPFDRWYYGGDSGAVGTTVKRGFTLFMNNDCVSCHQIDDDGALFADGDFHDTGIGYFDSVVRQREPHRLQIAPGVIIDVETDVMPPRPSDLGRYEATGLSEDRWKYSTPSLRNVAITAPYMHNGSFGSLALVIEFYAKGGEPHEGQDERIRPRGLSEQDKADLVAFLEALTGSNVDALAADARTAPIGDFQ